MKISEGNHIWKGYFSYHLKDHNGKNIKKDVNFSMTIKMNSDGTFSGFSIDEESRGLFSQPILVKGFVEEKFISFTVMYPYNYFFDELVEELVVDYENPYPGCDYSGEYDEKTDRFQGVWSIEIGETNKGIFQENFLVELYTGSWVIQL